MILKNAILASAVGASLLAQTTTSPVFACNMKAIRSADRPRYDDLLKKIKSAVKLQRELPDGYAWELDGDSASMPEAAEWMAMERRCCSFLTLQLEAAGPGSHYAVKLLGPDGVKAFLVNEFKIAAN